MILKKHNSYRTGNVRMNVTLFAGLDNFVAEGYIAGKFGLNRVARKS